MSDRGKGWAWILDLVTMIAVLIGLTFGAIELRELRSAQESQAVLELYRTIQTPEFTRGAQLIWDLPTDLSAAELRALESTDEGLLMQQVTTTFEALGVMVYRRDVPIEWVDELFRQMILMSWDKFELLTLDSRRLMDYGGILEWHQWLAERLLERSGGEEPVPAYEAYRDWTESGR